MTIANLKEPDGVVLVTGASGFIGSAVANALRARGWNLRVLVRKTSPRANIDPNDALFEGDVRDRAAVAAALRGVRYLFHVAADYRLWAAHPHEIFSTNVEGVRIVMQEALRAGVERIVHTSTVATLTPVPDRLADETCRLDPKEAVGAYKTSKTIGERLVETMVRQEGLPAVIVNPSTPIGPRDIKPTPTGRIVVDAARGRIPAFVNTGLNIVHVDDVAQGHLAALEKGIIGERYILGGENVALSDMLVEIAQMVGRRPPFAKLPHSVVYPFALGAESIARITGKAPLLSRETLRMSKQYMYFDDLRARLELGYCTRPHRQALSDAIAWYRREGFLG